ncbi:hypothetical protein ACHAPA_007394 [Fusarium lateritium]
MVNVPVYILQAVQHPQNQPSSFERLPVELILLILETLDKSDYLNIRVVSKAVKTIATKLAFHSILFEPRALYPQSFTNIATSPHLRKWVREITVDSWLGQEWELFDPPYHKSNTKAILDALQHVYLFRDLKTIHVRFGPTSGDLTDPDLPSLQRGERGPYRREVLLIILRAVTRKPLNRTKKYRDEYCDGPINISTLTITNLSDTMDTELMDLISSSELLELKSLTDFKLSLARDVVVNDSSLRSSVGSFYNAIELLKKNSSCMLTNLFGK